MWDKPEEKEVCVWVFFPPLLWYLIVSVNRGAFFVALLFASLFLLSKRPRRRAERRFMVGVKEDCERRACRRQSWIEAKWAKRGKTINVPHLGILDLPLEWSVILTIANQWAWLYEWLRTGVGVGGAGVHSRIPAHSGWLTKWLKWLKNLILFDEWLL